ncbi:hypothetical protein M2475_000590 [Breznakia sp. PF5-3]|uniref:hypothetical protein n=1 Tax=unclassified Breznakia TaxID=2623764 RepID=UPI00240525D7|nr:MULTISPECIES: hypothetical protein [unclassified Breznakia]MDF9824232.1 hypothetical protein [Breznakia sp. PM6-1]MDF9835030.1 hypothetical protein [Breznakia sp. PF5-3]MDF9837275.1 hypothetical protein [Breznakia sp. PFB2-8]MDF9859265.1 hypothetical protein [Breznakia sp. PH5-24]
MRKLKKQIAILTVLIIAFITCASPLQAVHYSQVPSNNGGHRLQNSIAYVGGGRAPFTENGVTYYNAGNVIELTVTLPANTYAVSLQEIITYDLNQVDLVTSFNDIRQTFGQSLLNEGWAQDVFKMNGNNNQILLSAAGSDWTNHSSIAGGVVGKIRFRIKEQTTTNVGTNININFVYQIAGAKPNGKGLAYIHAGYDPSNEGGTYQVSAPTISIAAHKIPSAPTTPTNPEKPTDPVVDYHPSVVIDKEISESKKKEIAAITAKRDYSFAKSNDFMNGKNSYRNIAKMLIDQMVKTKDKIKYQTYEFKDQYLDIKAKKTIVKTTCYTHYLYIGMSFVVIFVTYGYKKYLEANRKVKWRS